MPVDGLSQREAFFLSLGRVVKERLERRRRSPSTSTYSETAATIYDLGLSRKFIERLHGMQSIECGCGLPH
jgi:hypothetical protein